MLTNCEIVVKIGKIKYSDASCQPIGGAKSESNGSNQLKSLASVGPASEGRKNHASSNAPSMPALLNARYKPAKTGNVKSNGPHPASGLTLFSSYNRLISTFMRSESSSYFSRINLICGCKFFMFSELTT